MSKEDKLRASIERARRVKELLENPLIKETFELMEKALFDEFKSAKFKEDDLRNELWQRMQLLRLHKSTFETYLKEGDRAEKTLLLTIKDKIGL